MEFNFCASPFRFHPLRSKLLCPTWRFRWTPPAVSKVQNPSAKFLSHSLPPSCFLHYKVRSIWSRERKNFACEKFQQIWNGSGLKGIHIKVIEWNIFRIRDFQWARRRNRKKEAGEENLSRGSEHRILFSIATEKIFGSEIKN